MDAQRLQLEAILREADFVGLLTDLDISRMAAAVAAAPLGARAPLQSPGAACGACAGLCLPRHDKTATAVVVGVEGLR
eukprot:11215302-Lingulodinium_polyedra.AAC.3